MFTLSGLSDKSAESGVRSELQSASDGGALRVRAIPCKLSRSRIQSIMSRKHRFKQVDGWDGEQSGLTLWTSGGPAALGLHTLWAVALTWPLILNPASQIPLGSERSPTIPLFNLWTLGWNATWLSDPVSSYWDAPIFHPVAGTFAFSDPQPMSGILGALLWWASPAAAYNLVLLLFLVLNGFAARHFLVSRGTGRAPALLAGLLVQALPFLTHERGVLQLQPVFGIILAAHYFWRLVQEPTRWAGIGLGLTIGATFLTSEYYALFLFFFLLPALPPAFRSVGRSQLLPLVTALLLVALPALLVVMPQAQFLAEMGFNRDISTIEEFSAKLSDYFRRSPFLLSVWTPESAERLHGNFLWPGFGLLGLALLGAWQSLTRISSRRIALHLVVSAVLALLLSLGPTLRVGDWRPYETLGTLVPGMGDLRSPFRFAVLVQISMALLTGFGLQALRKRVGARWMLVVAVMVLLECVPRPASMVQIPPLAGRQRLESPGVVIPFVQGSRAEDYFETVAAMCLLLPSRIELINGYSGYFPSLNGQLKNILADFPTARGFAALRALGVRNVFVDVSTLNAATRQRLESALAGGELEAMEGIGGVSVFRLRGSSLRPASEYRGGWRVQARARGREIEITASPSELGDEVFVVAPRSAPLVWEVGLSRPGASPTAFLRQPLGAHLLYGSGIELKTRIPRPAGSGDCLLELRLAESGKVLGEAGCQF